MNDISLVISVILVVISVLNFICAFVNKEKDIGDTVINSVMGAMCMILAKLQLMK